MIADGHKRYSAYRGLDRPDILVEVWPLRRWLRDQLRSGDGNARKNGRILAASVTDPRQAWRLLLTTLLHWRRVATSLLASGCRPRALSASASAPASTACDHGGGTPSGRARFALAHGARALAHRPARIFVGQQVIERVDQRSLGRVRQPDDGVLRRRGG